MKLDKGLKLVNTPKIKKENKVATERTPNLIQPLMREINGNTVNSNLRPIIPTIRGPQNIVESELYRNLVRNQQIIRRIMYG